jgi:hypothetical protein
MPAGDGNIPPAAHVRHEPARRTMDFELTHGRAVLERTPSTLRALLGGLPPDWTTATDGPDTWSPHQVVAHLINGERTDWIPRARLILAGEPRATFTPFDREGFFEEARAIPLGRLLDMFARLRRESLATLDAWSIGDRELAMTARHPEFGAVTLRQLLATWVAHDLGHVVQISRTMARQYHEAVGPWKAYLSVLRTRDQAC